MRSRAGRLPQGVLLRVRDVQVQGDANLTQVALAHGGLTGRLGARKGGQKQARQNGNDGDNHEKFDEGESLRTGESRDHSETLAAQPSAKPIHSGNFYQNLAALASVRFGAH